MSLWVIAGDKAWRAIAQRWCREPDRYITERCKKTSPALQDDDESKFTLDEEEEPPAGGSPAAAALSTQVRAQLRP